MTVDSRHRILLAVKEQTALANDVTNSEDPSQSPVWTQQQWWEAFQFLFLEDVGHPAKQQSKDDMLFFALVDPPEPTKEQPNPAPFIVRRKAKALPQELQLSGHRFHEVSWDASVILNIVLQASFQLTVVACRQEQVPLLAGGSLSSGEVLQVTKTVFASPTYTAVNLDSSRCEAAEPVVTYPDICFAVDNFDDTFEDVVLSEGEQCYCVLLSAAVDGDISASFSRQRTADLEALPSTASSTTDLDSIPSDRPTIDAPPPLQDEPSSTSQGNGYTTPDRQLSSSAAQNGNTSPLPEASEPLDTDRADSSGLVPGSSEVVAQYEDLSISGRPSSETAEHLPTATSSLNLGRQTLSGRLESQDSVRTVWGSRRVELFAGFVSQAQITGHISKQERGINSLAVLGAILGGGRQQQKERIIMTGPGGLGRAEVAVTLMPPTGSDQPQAEAQPPSPQPQTTAGGRPSLLKAKLLQRVKDIAGQVSKAMAEERMAANVGRDGPVSLQCALITLRLPVHIVTQKLLSVL